MPTSKPARRSPSSVRYSLFSLFCFLSAVLCPLSSVFAQGSLTPPGAPAATMKTLDQIEPRTPISSLPFTISTGGSYYLTKSLSVSSSNGITIAVSGVTLDLNGFEITSTESSPTHSGILINSGLSDIRIKNGSIRGNVTQSGNTFTGSGFANGIQANGTPPVNAHVSDISVAGCLSGGINLGSGLVESCTVSTVGGIGIYADNVVYCNSYGCGGTGMSPNYNATGCSVVAGTTAYCAIQCGGSVTSCWASCSPTGGQAVIEAQVARDCYAYAISGAGDAIGVVTAESCNGYAYGSGNGVNGYYLAANCYGTSSGAGDGVLANTAENCIGIATGAGVGVSATVATGCNGTSTNNTGLMASSATNCYGTNLLGTNAPAGGTSNGVSAQTATGCYGVSTSGTGLAASAATNCTGVTSTGTGLSAGDANTCEGIITSTAADNTSLGLYSGGDALNCHGQASGNAAGLFSVNATGCSAYTDKGTALEVPLSFGVATGCVGKSQGGGIGLEGFIANSCSIPAGTQSITHKYNMP